MGDGSIWGVLFSVAIALAASWAALAAFLVIARPQGLLIQEALRLLPDTLILLRRLATDRTLPSSVRTCLWLLAGLKATVAANGRP